MKALRTFAGPQFTFMKPKRNNVSPGQEISNEHTYDYTYIYIHNIIDI